jgi:hypothetical protein
VRMGVDGDVHDPQLFGLTAGTPNGIRTRAA